MQDPAISNTQQTLTPPPEGVSQSMTNGMSSVSPVSNGIQNPGTVPPVTSQPLTNPGTPASVPSAPQPVTSTPAPDEKTVPSSVSQAPQAKKEEKSTSKETSKIAKNGEPEVRKVDIEKVVSNWTGIPITKLTEDEGAKLLNLEKRIHQRLIDQAEAVTAVAEAVRRGRIGLAAANRPIASFIFLGPSGTGKTELAKTLAEILFGKDDAMVRLDMSEYMEKHEVAKLIGAPPGYVGYEEGGQLTEAVRAKPYSIVLLDEVEKAHPDVFNILLQLLEDGRLTDNKGNTISFKNTIVICTSNIGSALITQKLGEKDGKELSEQDFDKEFTELTTLVNGELRKFFRPELLNRFDDIVIFKPLRRQDMKSIAKLGIEKTSKLLQEQDVKLVISDKALAQLALEGYDPVYGARPLRRLIQTSIENPIAVLLIAKTFVAGDTIMIDYDQAKSDYSFRKATAQDIADAAKKAEDEKNGVKAQIPTQNQQKPNTNGQTGNPSSEVQNQGQTKQTVPPPNPDIQNQQNQTKGGTPLPPPPMSQPSVPQGQPSAPIQPKAS